MGEPAGGGSAARGFLQAGRNEDASAEPPGSPPRTWRAWLAHISVFLGNLGGVCFHRFPSAPVVRDWGARRVRRPGRPPPVGGFPGKTEQPRRLKAQAYNIRFPGIFRESRGGRLPFGNLIGGGFLRFPEGELCQTLCGVSGPLRIRGCRMRFCAARSPFLRMRRFRSQNTRPRPGLCSP